jgi:dTDP-4-dehydrorhamnose reductase
VASWHAFAKAILDLLPQDQQSQLTAISSAEFASPVQRPVNSSLDTGKFERVFGLSVPNWLEALKWCLER